jgi:hypothetical protein
MQNIVIFSADGSFLGYKEYGQDPEVLPDDEFSISDEMFAQKEYLALVNGVPTLTVEKKNQSSLKNLKVRLKAAFESKAVELRYDDSIELVGFANDHANLVFKQEALAFIEWRSSIYNKFFDLQSSKPEVLPSFDQFMLTVDTYEFYLAKQKMTA